MTERNERVEALLRAFVIKNYREDHGFCWRRNECTEHLPHCPDIRVAELDAHDSTYGCETGCEYVRFAATLTCPHGDRTVFKWGSFGELGDIIDDLTRMDNGQEATA